jgi:hypothetical protein
MKTIELPFECYLEIKYESNKGTEPHYDHAHGNWLPGEAAYVKIVDVYIGQGKYQASILGQLTDNEITDLENQIFVREQNEDE